MVDAMGSEQGGRSLHFGCGVFGPKGVSCRGTDSDLPFPISVFPLTLGKPT